MTNQQGRSVRAQRSITIHSAGNSSTNKALVLMASVFISGTLHVPQVSDIKQELGTEQGEQSVRYFKYLELVASFFSRTQSIVWVGR